VPTGGTRGREAKDCGAAFLTHGLGTTLDADALRATAGQPDPWRVAPDARDLPDPWRVAPDARDLPDLWRATAGTFSAGPAGPSGTSSGCRAT